MVETGCVEKIIPLLQSDSSDVVQQVSLSLYPPPKEKKNCKGAKEGDAHAHVLRVGLGCDLGPLQSLWALGNIAGDSAGLRNLLTAQGLVPVFVGLYEPVCFAEAFTAPTML